MVSLRFGFLAIYVTLLIFPSWAFASDKKVASESNSESLLTMYSTQKVQLEILTEQHRAQITDIQAELAKSDVRLSELKSDFDKQSKEFAVLQEAGNGVNKRVDDTLSLTAIIGGLFGTLITVLLGGLGLLGYVTVTRKTKQEAEAAASNWFKDNSDNLLNQVNELKMQVVRVRDSLTNSVIDVEEHANNAKARIDTSSDEIIKLRQSVSVSADNKNNTQTTVNPMLLNAAASLQDMPQSQYTFDDWDTLAYGAYLKGEYEDAAFYWGKVFADKSADSTQKAKAIYKRGVAQGKLNQSEQAIQTYDALIAYVGDDKTPALRELVAKAIGNKGVTQGQLNQSEQAIQTFEALIAYVGLDDKTPALRVLVAKAMVNKGVTQGRLNQPEQEIQTYNELIAYVGADQAPALRELVADAYNAIGFCLLCDSKQLIQKGDIAGANKLLNQSFSKFELAIKEKASGMFTGNKAYALALLGQHDESERIFAQALHAEVHGGESLYQATLKDFDIHPIPQDDAFREIVERQWALYEQERKGE